ncbi:hypothetical protein [Kribbella sp. NPDC000426]|uniref:hypothetical protein n=1 Tax=Kribbella sp. NPDC000426 TaxID=3154255 RepID=UPI00333299A7
MRATFGPEAFTRRLELEGNIFWSFAPHNLYVTGTRVLVNNQTHNAGFKLCPGRNGTGQCGPVSRVVGAYQPHDFSGVKSIVLVK